MSDEPVKFWDWVSSISHTKNLPFTKFNCTTYSSWLVSQHFGQFEDCILHANELNMYKCVSERAHFHYFHNRIRPKKRYSGKWAKATKNENLEILKEYYPLESVDNLLGFLRVLDDNDIRQIKKELEKGGKL